MVRQQPSHQPLAGSMRQTEMQGDGTAALVAPGGWVEELDIESATGKARIFAPKPPYGFLSKPLANIYERVIGRIPSIPPSVRCRRRRDASQPETNTDSRKGR